MMPAKRRRGSGKSCAPFTCPESFAGTRYQQLDDSSLFSGPMLIKSLSFYSANSTAALRAGTYDTHLSTNNKFSGSVKLPPAEPKAY